VLEPAGLQVPLVLELMDLHEPLLLELMDLHDPRLVLVRDVWFGHVFGGRRRGGSTGGRVTEGERRDAGRSRCGSVGVVGS
jgi:hypothetical protein